MSAEEHGAEHSFKRQDKGAHPFPAHVSLRRHLEHTTALTLADEGIAVPESLSAGNVTAEKAKHMFGVVLPHDFVGLHVHFNDTGAGHDGVVSAVVKDEHVPLGSEIGIVLVADLAATPLPQDFPFGPGDPHDRAEFTKTDEDISVSAGLNGIRMTPLMPEFPAADNVCFRIQVLPGMPRMHRVTLGIDLQDSVSKKTAQVPGPASHSEAFHEKTEVLFVLGKCYCRFFADEALDPLCKLRGHLFPGDDEGVSVGEAAHVVMKGRVLPAPDLLSVPVHFYQNICSTARGRYAGSGLIQRLTPDEKVPSRQEVAISWPEGREIPAMHYQAGIVEQIRRVPTNRSDERESAACAGILVGKTCLPKRRPTHE